MSRHTLRENQHPCPWLSWAINIWLYPPRVHGHLSSKFYFVHDCILITGFIIYRNTMARFLCLWSIINNYEINTQIGKRITDYCGWRTCKLMPNTQKTLL